MTKSQFIIYYSIKKFIERTGRSPILKEICYVSGKNSTATVLSHIRNLESLGYIEYISKGKRKGIRIKREW